MRGNTLSDSFLNFGLVFSSVCEDLTMDFSSCPKLSTLNVVEIVKMRTEERMIVRRVPENKTCLKFIYNEFKLKINIAVDVNCVPY